MNGSGRLQSRLQRLEEHPENRGVTGIVTRRGGIYSLADRERLRDTTEGLLAAGHSFVYIAHLARELPDNELQEIR